MLPFPKRPLAPNEYDLQTGDYVAYDASSQPSRQPLWGRSTAVQSFGNVQVAPHVRADMQRMHGSYAPPPASLAPVAMSAHAVGTGSYPAHPTVIVRGRPDMRWGITLAIAGALLGGVLGVTMNNGKHRAAIAEAPPLMMAAAQPVQAPPQAIPAAPMTTAPVSMAPVASPVVAPQPAMPPQPVAAAQPAAPAPVAQPAAPSNPFAARPTASANVVAVKNPVVQPPAPAPRAPSHPSWHPAPPAHHAAHGGGMVAAKVQPPAPAPAAPAAKGNQTEEMKLLRDATKESDNSLGGSR